MLRKKKQEVRNSKKVKEEMIAMMAKDLKIKDTLLLKGEVEFKEFKTKLDIYEYRNNYDFEGNLIQKSFMENYEYLMNANEHLKTTEFETREELSTAKHTLSALIEQRKEMKKSLIALSNVKTVMTELREPFMIKLNNLREEMTVFSNLVKKNIELLEKVKIESKSLSLAELMPEGVLSKLGALKSETDAVIVEKIVQYIETTDSDNWKMNYFASIRDVDCSKADVGRKETKTQQGSNIIRNSVVFKTDQKISVGKPQALQLKSQPRPSNKPNGNKKPFLILQNSNPEEASELMAKQTDEMEASYDQGENSGKVLTSPGHTAKSYTFLSPKAIAHPVTFELGGDSMPEWTAKILEELQPGIQAIESIVSQVYEQSLRVVDEIGELILIETNF